MKYFLKKIAKNRKGSFLLSVVVFGSVTFMIIVSGIASYALFEHKASNRKQARDMSFHIAEAGIEYYRWHLAHNPNDFTDGTGEVGPYIHDFEDKNGNIIGTFSLDITPPLDGSTIVTVQSTGWLNHEPNIRRTIQVRLGFPSFADYTYLSNANMWFGGTADVHGKIHSNGGIRFDGTTDSWVYSAEETYDYSGSAADGVWGAGGPQEFWQFPVPAVDFFGVTADMATIRDGADENGIRIASSGDEGWHLVFDGDSFDQYRVTSRDCYYGNGFWWWGWWYGDVECFDIRTEQFVATQNIPANGMLFVEDHVWVEGVVDGRVTVAAARADLQEPYKNIMVTGNLTYHEHGSDDVVGLISQADVIIPYEVQDDMIIEAAMLSQFGTLYRPYYDDNTRNSLSIFGSQISYDSGGWAYVSGGNIISGFLTRNHSYDGNLRYFPPPGFPVGDTYDVISWEEIE